MGTSFATGATVWARQTAKTAPQAARYGPFSVENYETVTTSLSKNGVKGTLTGDKLRARSNLYDVDARTVTFTLARTGTPVRQKLTDSVATGGVRIVVRNPEAGRITIVTCDKAVYKASLAATDRGRIDLTGNIRTEVRDPAAVGPAVLTAQTGYIDLVSPDETNVVLNRGSANATLREPPPKPAAPKKGP